MNILLALAWATAILAIIVATASVIATTKARRRWNTATRAAEDALERADRARRHHDIAREDLKAQRKLLEAQTPSTVTFGPEPISVKPAGNPRQVAEQIVRRTRKLGQNRPTMIRPTQTSQPRDDATDALGHSLMGMVIADAVVHNNTPEQDTVTGTPTYTPAFTPTYTPDPSPSSSSYDSGSSSSSSSYDSGSSSSYDSGSNSSGGGDF